MIILWAAIVIFAAAVFYILHKRVAFFTPESLKGLLPANAALFLVRTVAYLSHAAAKVGLAPLGRVLSGALFRGPAEEGVDGGLVHHAPVHAGPPEEYGGGEL